LFIDVIFTVLSLAFILLSCFVFTNAVEWFGKKLNLGQGVVGSIFAAVGTALPETIIPIIAIMFHSGEKSREIGIGAIAGAPFMLGTLAFFVTGTAVFIYTFTGRRTLEMQVDTGVISRDLSFFIAIYGIAVLTSFINTLVVLKDIIAVLLLFSYIIYVKKSVSNDCAQCENLDPLYFSKIFRKKPGLFLIVLQLALALCGIVYGADIFVKYVELMSNLLGVTPLILSIIVTPIATELPEKLNSVILTGRKKDTLALGNITGAMVFQSCFPVVFGMVFTQWNLTGITLVSAAIALCSAVYNLVWIKVRKAVSPFALLFGGVLYTIFLLYVFL
jgi:cation:H+ antiporter